MERSFKTVKQLGSEAVMFLCNFLSFPLLGWGKTHHKGYMSQMLRQVEVPPVDRKKCAVRLAKSPGKKFDCIVLQKKKNHMTEMAFPR